ncbi:MAG: hypothetical protein AB8F94_06590 [Saprospiraceae bacterium]
MSNKNQDPLDLEEVFSPEKELPITPLQRFLQNLEIIPLIILAIGLGMKYKEMAYSSEVLIIGGTTSALLYMAFSWLMFRVGKYKSLEVILSILCGLAFGVGILAILFRLESWEMSEEMLSIGITGMVGLLFVSIGLFAFHLKDKRASVFYRNVIARLLIFTVLLLYFSRLYF